MSSAAPIAAAAASVGDASPTAWNDRFLPEDLPTLDAPAYYGDFEKARDLLQFGRYKAALYASFKLPAADATDVALLRGEAYWRIGQLNLARSTLNAIKTDPRAALLLARINLDEADADAAIATLKPLVAADPNALAPHHWLGVAYEAKGDLAAAAEQHKFFADGDDSVLGKFTREGAAAFEPAEDLTLGAASVDRWAALTGQYATHPDLHATVLSMFVAAYDTVDRAYWPAHVAAARYLFSHGNKTEASKELDEANKANPNAADVNELLGEIAIDAHSDDGLELAIESLREVDPTSATADLLDVRLQLSHRAPDSALAIATRLTQRQPKNIDALAALAAVHAGRGDLAKMNEVFAAVDAINPKDATSRLLVAGVLSSTYYDNAGAIDLLQTAVDRAPWWTAPQHALGVALIQEGDEDAARRVLDKAYVVDQYNILTVNYLRVLDQLTKFKEADSERFTFKFAPVDDPIVPLYLGPTMDAMYDDLVKQFAFTPPKKPIVEVFPDAQSFSVRTAGMPGLETYGASLGRVMTVVAPRAGETLGPFNWARVLRHEFTHTINLMQTHGRVPRWLTEGLAVWEEHVPFRFAWVPEKMYERATKDEIFTPREMAQALIKPTKPGDGEIAYMTGFWTVRYIDENQGWDAVLKLLSAYGEGKSDDEAFRAAIGKNVAEFHTDFAAWAKDQVKSWGYDEETSKRVDNMTTEAELITKAGGYDKAIEQWLAIRKEQPVNSLVARRLAGIYLKLNRPADALPELIASLPLELQDNRFAKRIARIYDSTGDAANAMKYATAAIGVDPYDPDAHELLATLYTKANEPDKAKQETNVAKLLEDRKDGARKPATP